MVKGGPPDGSDHQFALSRKAQRKDGFTGCRRLSDEELVAILLGSGTPAVPLHQICGALLKNCEIRDIAQLDMQALCGIRGIGPAKAMILLAAAEFSRRVESRVTVLAEPADCAVYLRQLLAKADQLQYIVLLLNRRHELLAFAEAGSVLPDVAWLTGLATAAGAVRLILGRNGWATFSHAECRFLLQLRAACGALNIICEGLMAIGKEQFKLM